MPAQISTDIRALFSDLGVSIAGSERDAVLVIDRFEHLRNPIENGANAVPGCAGCLGTFADVFADAA
ncbi:hypothetical protein [Amycolatopsis sp. NPDC051128]|uniref:hypothetical protein n=1 Tax=Amycolatopsis sp. NPDC051128 TaxID=3155412 RepID=UPI00342052E1